MEREVVMEELSVADRLRCWLEGKEPNGQGSRETRLVLITDALAEIETLERHRKHWEESQWQEQQRAAAAEAECERLLEACNANNALFHTATERADAAEAREREANHRAGSAWRDLEEARKRIADLDKHVLVQRELIGPLEAKAAALEAERAALEGRVGALEAEAAKWPVPTLKARVAELEELILDDMANVTRIHNLEAALRKLRPYVAFEREAMSTHDALRLVDAALEHTQSATALSGREGE